MNDDLNIALCCDERFAIPCLTCIVSILENNRAQKCNIFVVTSELTESSIRKFEKLAKIYHQEIQIKTISSVLYDGLPYLKRYTYATYNRLLFPSLIEESKILFLDCDIIVKKDLSSIWKTNITGFACAVVEDQRNDDVRFHNRILTDTKFFNAGMMLMNLDYWRDNHVSENAIQWLKDYPERCLYADQDALNVCLSGKIRFLDYSYNIQDDWFKPNEKWFTHHSKWQQIEKAKEDPVIIHFNHHFKPWFKECKHPFKQDFIKYATMYDFIDYKERHFYSLPVRVLMFCSKIVHQIIGT
jgi:lipopolysaccharide biosynthesis glycosyltransferase